MADKYCMKFILHTLTDITKTNARRSDDSYQWKQQQNYNTLVGVLGLRVNPIIKVEPKVKKQSIDNLGFGKKYKGRQNVWELVFETEYEGGLNLEMLEQDFDLIPIIADLDESVKFSTDIFRSTTDEKNIVFNYVDKE